MPKEAPQDSLNSMEGLPRQDIPVTFDAGEKKEVVITDAELQRTDVGAVAGWLDTYNNSFTLELLPQRQ